MGDSSRKAKVFWRGCAAHCDAVPGLDLASQVAVKRAVAKLWRLEMKKRFLSFLLAGAAEIRRLVGGAIVWLGRKDADSANELDQLVLLKCRNALMELQIRLFQFSISIQQILFLDFCRKQSLLDFVHLLKQLALHGQNKGLISCREKPCSNGLNG